MGQDLTFEAQDRPLSEILFSQRRFRVPRYQRPYAWDTDQASQFWEDLLASPEPYFLGTFIFNNESVKEDGYADIIDGQQRLITATILIAVLRDHAKQIDVERARLYQRQDIAIEDRDGRESFRILPSDTLTTFFVQHIQRFEGAISNAKPSTAEEQRVVEVYSFLYQRVAAELKRFESRQSQLDLLDRLRNEVAALIAISVEISREEDAYEIFETTNARGLELSVADLLKNLVFKKIKPGEDRDFAKEVWLEITNDIESTSTELKRFIRYFWISRYSFISEKKLYREIKNRTTDWHGLLNDLWDDSTWFNRLLEGEETDFQDLKRSDRIFDAVFALRPMRVSQCYVLLLSVLRNYSLLGTDPVRVFELIERFTFQYSVVCKLPANRIEKIYSKFALKIQQAGREGPPEKAASRVQPIFADLEKELRAEAPSEAVFKDSFQRLSHRDTEDGRRLTKYVLAKLNAFHQKTDEHSIDFNAVSIEHILPRNPSKGWGLTKKEIKPYVNKLGNLTLLSKRLNSKAQNAPLLEKLPELQKSELPITKEVVNLLSELEGVWNEQTIEARQSQLADLAFKSIWAL